MSSHSANGERKVVEHIQDPEGYLRSKLGSTCNVYTVGGEFGTQSFLFLSQHPFRSPLLSIFSMLTFLLPVLFFSQLYRIYEISLIIYIRSDESYGDRYSFALLFHDTIISDRLASKTMWEFHVQLAAFSVIHPNSTVLDVGGNIGAAAIPFARAGEAKCTVHAFEPQSVIFNILNENIIANNLSQRCFPHHLAIGHTQGQTTLANTLRVEASETRTELNYNQPNLVSGGVR